jgi:hypothetical protein
MGSHLIAGTHLPLTSRLSHHPIGPSSADFIFRKSYSRYGPTFFPTITNPHISIQTTTGTSPTSPTGWWGTWHQSAPLFRPGAGSSTLSNASSIANAIDARTHFGEIAFTAKSERSENSAYERGRTGSCVSAITRSYKFRCHRSLAILVSLPAAICLGT